MIFGRNKKIRSKKKKKLMKIVLLFGRITMQEFHYEWVAPGLTPVLTLTPVRTDAPRPQQTKQVWIAWRLHDVFTQDQK